MAVSVNRITLWRIDVENRPGVLAGTLEPLASATPPPTGAKRKPQRR